MTLKERTCGGEDSLFAALALLSAVSLAAAPERSLSSYTNVTVLLIGINDYPTLGQLSTAEKDARELAELFQHHYGYRTKLLLGKHATKSSILVALDQLNYSSTPASSVIVFFAGHGVTVQLPPCSTPRQRDCGYRTGFLVPHGVSLEPANTNVDAWRSQAIEMSSLAEHVRTMRSRHVLFFIDACYSGFIGRRSPPMTRLDHRLLFNGRSRFVITAGTENQEAFEVSDIKGVGSSVFVQALKQVLVQSDPMSVREVFIALRQKVTLLSQQLLSATSTKKSPMLPQLREIAIEDGEFVFVPTTALSRRYPSDDSGIKVSPGSAGVDSEIARILARPVFRTSITELVEIACGYCKEKAVSSADSKTPAGVSKTSELGSLRKVVLPLEERFAKRLQLAAAGDPLAMAGVFYHYVFGVGVPKDIGNALFWAKELADLQHPAGKYLMGLVNEAGLGITLNPADGRRLQEQALEEGFPVGLFEDSRARLLTAF